MASTCASIARASARAVFSRASESASSASASARARTSAAHRGERPGPPRRSRDMLPCMPPAAPSTRAPALAEVVRALERADGEPAPPRFTDPFDLILLENASYLVDDERREAVFEGLSA